MIDILSRLDDELDRTPANSHACRPLPRGVVAAAAAEIRRLRVTVELQRSEIDARTTTLSPDTVTDTQ